MIYDKLASNNTDCNKMEDSYMNKRLHKGHDRMLCGVCSGIAEYFDLDPTLVRLGWVIFTLAAGSGLLAYIIGAVIIPD
jgi:phage shock protein PspC (stress-responsive transcriptional regulator)